MVVFKRGVKQHMGKSLSLKSRRALLDDLRLQESPGSMNRARHVIIVMDAMKEFTTEPLEWALENVIKAGSVVILLGVMPWLNIPLSSKTWLDVWPVGLEELSFVKEKIEWTSDVKYLKLQAVVDLCKNYGVYIYIHKSSLLRRSLLFMLRSFDLSRRIRSLKTDLMAEIKILHHKKVLLQKKVVMGYPSRLLVVKEITSLHATWVVFDRHQKNDRKFYAGKLPCNMVMMNEEGEADMIKGRTMIDSTIRESAASLLSTPILLISDHLKGILKKPKRARKDLKEDQSHDFAVIDV